MTTIDRIRVWLWLDLWMPTYSAWRNWWAWRRATEEHRRMTNNFLAMYGNPKSTDEPKLLLQSAFIECIEDSDGDYAKSPRTVALLCAQGDCNPVPCDCEDFATLGAWQFSLLGIHGQIVTMIRRGKRTWRTLWFEPWEAHAVWVSTGHAYMVDNATVIQDENAVEEQMRAWFQRGFEPVHWSPTK